MDQLLEFVGNHPYLVTAAVVLAMATIHVEIRVRGQSGLKLGALEATRAVNKGGLILDLRDAEAYGKGHLAGARNVSLAELPAQAEELRKYQAKPVLVCCENGGESLRAVRALRKSGFEQAYALKDGILNWRRENLPLVEGPAEG